MIVEIETRTDLPLEKRCRNCGTSDEVAFILPPDIPLCKFCAILWNNPAGGQA